MWWDEKGGVDIISRTKASEGWTARVSPEEGWEWKVLTGTRAEGSKEAV